MAFRGLGPGRRGAKELRDAANGAGRGDVSRGAGRYAWHAGREGEALSLDAFGVAGGGLEPPSRGPRAVKAAVFSMSFRVCRRISLAARRWACFDSLETPATWLKRRF